jgi:glycosyltransferase involved in cell wall biosynthesis
MPSLKHTIYYDVTQLVHWDGRLTGIPRVMHEQAIRFREERPETVFVSWVKELQEFVELDLDQTLRERGRGVYYLKIGESRPLAKSTDVAAASADFKEDQQIIMRQGAVRLIKAVLRRGAPLMPALSSKVETRLKLKRMASYKIAAFQKGDQVFIPWGEWWDDNFIAKLEQWHRENGLGIVQIVHDMGPVVIPQFTGAGASGGSTETFPKYCRTILPITDLVLCVSENTKKEATAWLKAQKLTVPRMEVFRLGDDFKVAKATEPTDEVFKKAKLKESEYLLTVCTIEARKNHALLYYVYKLALARGIDLPKIAIVGRRGWGTEEIYSFMTNDPAMKDKFVFLHNMGDEELSWLYNHCQFTVFPSFYEGWGIPIAESVARGVPCLCSNTTSMVEIAEGFVDHFSPASADECLEKITKLLIPKNLETARERVKGYKQFSWDSSFKQVIEHLED